MDMAARFGSLFPGRSDVWGALHGEDIKETVTLAHYSRHLLGLTSLGIYPLRPDGRVHWLAIDIDHNDPDPVLAVVETLYSLGLNAGVYLERSKGYTEV